MSKFDLDTVHVPEKASILADTLLHCCYHDLDVYDKIAVGIDFDLLDYIC